MTNISSDVLVINQNQLDRELVQQAQTFYEVAQEYAEAISRRDAAYEGIKTTDAELYFHLRAEYENQGVKITESLLSQKVLTHPDHLTAHAAHNAAKLEADKLMALKEAFAQRAYMLRDLIQLYTTGYFTETSVSGNHTTTTAQDIAYMANRNRIVEKKTEGNNVRKPNRTLTREKIRS